MGETKLTPLISVQSKLAGRDLMISRCSSVRGAARGRSGSRDLSRYVCENNVTRVNKQYAARAAQHMSVHITVTAHVHVMNLAEPLHSAKPLHTSSNWPDSLTRPSASTLAPPLHPTRLTWGRLFAPTRLTCTPTRLTCTLA